MLIDWGVRSRLLQGRLKNKDFKPSFWLTPEIPPVSLGLLLDPAGVATWETAPVASVQLTPAKSPLAVEGVVPSGPIYVRLDFSLKVSVGSGTAAKIVLSFQQLFLGGMLSSPSAASLLIPVSYTLDDSTIVADKSRPLRKARPGGRRRFQGLHPLLTVRPGQIDINAEFVDATELWWDVHATEDKWGWYLHSFLGGRSADLRVLAWTAAGSPMLWFVAVPDAAGKRLEAMQGPEGTTSPEDVGANVVFFRPPPGVNAFAYPASAAGFVHKEHNDTTLYILARYLLSPIPATKLADAVKAGVKRAELLADQIQPIAPRPPPPVPPVPGQKKKHPVPPDPMDIDAADQAKFHEQFRFRPKFRPVGLEGAVNATGAPHLLFLPLGADTEGGYEGTKQAGLQATLASALFLLWNNNAIDAEGAGAPDPGARPLWLAGHSSGNLSMWVSLQNNAADVARVISFDATPMWNLEQGIAEITKAVKARGSGKKLDLFVISSPNMFPDTPPQKPQGSSTTFLVNLDDATDKKLRQTGAAITLLPDFGERAAFYTISPAASMTPYLRYLLQQWDDDEIETSVKNPGNWRFLFFHEFVVYSGHLVPAPPPASPGAPPASPSLRTFFQDALGPPKPRPSAP